MKDPPTPAKTDALPMLTSSSETSVGAPLAIAASVTVTARRAISKLPSASTKLPRPTAAFAALAFWMAAVNASDSDEPPPVGTESVEV